MSTLTVPVERSEKGGLPVSYSRTRSSSFIRALADVQHQGVHSTTFTAPSLSDNYTIPHLLDYHSRYSPSHTSMITLNKVYTLRDRALGAYRGVAYLHKTIKDAQKGSVVAFLAETEPIVYSTMVLAAMRAGYVPFPISNRNSVVAIEHLLKSTNCKHLIHTSTNTQLKNLAESAATNLPEVQLSSMPTHNDLYNETDTPPKPSLPPFNIHLNDPALIIHSSGSTSFPKPIVQSHRNVMHWGRVPYYGSTDVCGKVIFAGSLPAFHAMAVIFQIAVPLTTGLQVGCFDVQSPPIFPTSTNIMHYLRQMHTNFVIAPASIIKEWSGDVDAIAILKRLDAVMFGGSPMSEEVGDYLVRQGVKLSNQYGSTECGHTTSFFSAPSPDWQYFALSPHTKPCFVEEDGKGEGVFELQFLACDSHRPAVCNLSNTYGYATNDLVVMHPSNRNRMRIIGRKDDQIMLLNGEKTNPGPIEMIIASEDRIKNAVMFGRAKPVNGVLVEAASPVSNKDSFIDSIWHVVERANQFAPQHSRIFRNYILVTDAQRPFELTPKGNVKRASTLKLYESDIEDLYRRAEEEDSDAVALDISNAQQVVKAIVDGILPGVDSSSDLFTQGCDSLQATMIRNRLRNALPTHCKHKINQNVVFEHPRLNDLTRHVVALLSHKEVSHSTLLASQDLKRMVKKYTTGFATMPPKQVKQGGNVYLVTGTTGSLGSYILSELIASSECEKIYAVNRPNTTVGLLERQKKALKSRGLDESLALSSKVQLLEVDLSRPLTDAHMMDTVTHVIHNAWRVNFNLSLESFESDLQSLMNLTNFAIATKHFTHLSFLSSIGVLANWKRDRVVPEETLLDESVALGLGYGESKYVGERMLTAASKQTGLHTSIIRSGQIAGSRNSGSWNDNEWLPSIIRSAKSMGCLPDGHDDVAWLPVDVAARTVLDLSNSEGVFSLTHPHPASWNTVVSGAARRMGVPLVTYEEWLQKLHHMDATTPEADLIESMNKAPALKLKQFFTHSTISPERREYVEALGNPRLSTKKSCRVSESLERCEQLSECDMMKWMDYWGL